MQETQEDFYLVFFQDETPSTKKQQQLYLSTNQNLIRITIRHLTQKSHSKENIEHFKNITKSFKLDSLS